MKNEIPKKQKTGFYPVVGEREKGSASYPGRMEKEAS